MAAPTSLSETSETPCQEGAVHTSIGGVAGSYHSLHANPGRHGEIPGFETDSSLRFFARHLG